MTIRELETKLGHAEIARAEALAASKADRTALLMVRSQYSGDMERARTELAEERQARKKLEQALQRAQSTAGEERTRRAYTRRTPPPASPESEPLDIAVPRLMPVRDMLSANPTRKVRAKPEEGPEPEPVKWWLKTR